MTTFRRLLCVALLCTAGCAAPEVGTERSLGWDDTIDLKEFGKFWTKSFTSYATKPPKKAAELHYQAPTWMDTLEPAARWKRIVLEAKEGNHNGWFTYEWVITTVDGKEVPRSRPQNPWTLHFTADTPPNERLRAWVYPQYIAKECYEKTFYVRVGILDADANTWKYSKTVPINLHGVSWPTEAKK